MPVRVEKTRLLSCQSSPALSRWVAWRLRSTLSALAASSGTSRILQTAESLVRSQMLAPLAAASIKQQVELVKPLRTQLGVVEEINVRTGRAPQFPLDTRG